MLLKYFLHCDDNGTMKSNPKFAIFIALFAGLLIFSGWAQEQTPAASAVSTQVSDALKKAFADKNADAIFAALNMTQNDAEKNAAETMVLDEAKAQIFKKDLDSAAKYADAVLRFDFENQDAQNLYLSVDEQRTAQKKLEERKKAEEEAKKQALLQEEQQKKAIQAQEDLKKKEAEDKQKEVEFVESVKTVGTKNFSVNLQITPLSLLMYSSPFAGAYSGTQDLPLGLFLPVNLEGAFRHPYVYAGIKNKFGISLVPFGSADRLTEFSTRLSIGTPLTGIPICLSAGYVWYSYTEDSGEMANTVLFAKMSSPSVGLSLENVPIGNNADITASFMWLGASTQDSLIQAAFTGELSGRIVLLKMSNIALFVSPSVTGMFIVANSQIEWTCKPSVFAGVSINENR